MTRANWILLGLLVASLGWAFGASREASDATGERGVPVWKLEPGQVRRIEYQAGPVRVAMAVRGSDLPQLWVETETSAAVPAPAAKGAAAPKKEATVSVKDAFKGGPLAERMLQSLASLQAVRDIGAAEKLKLADFGLAGNASGTLRIERAGNEAPLRLDLGASGPGQATRYGLSSRDNHVYLLRQSLLQNLANPRPMMDRELLPVPVQEADQLELRLGGQTLTLYRLNAPPVAAGSARPSAAVSWGRSAQDPHGDVALSAVATALGGIKAVRYEANSPPLDPAKAALTVTLKKGPALIVEARFYETKTGEAPAISNYTVRPVAVSAALVKTLMDATRAAMTRNKT
jgi:hypothetical protein